MKILLKLAVLLLSPLGLNAYALPNPAAVNCTDQGNKYVLIKNTGFCVFNDRSYCEEWAYFRGTCISGNNFFPGRNFNPQRLNQYCVYKSGGVTTVKLCKPSQKMNSNG